MQGDERRELAELRGLLQEIDARLRRMEGAASVDVAPPSATPPTVSAAAAAPGAPPRPAAPRDPTPRRPSRTARLEEGLRAFFTEGNPLNKLGALSLILGSIIVFKYAVDNEWIGPTGRVALGFAVGASLFALGEVYARRPWPRFASGLAGAGNGVLFVAVYFGHQQYEIIPAAFAFALYVALTAAVVVQSLRYNVLGLAVWGLAGGYIAPILASTGSGNYVVSSTYLLVLNTGVLAVAYHRSWQPLKWMAFLLTAPYTAMWVVDYLDHPQKTRWLELHWLLPYLAAFFVYFAAIPTWRSLWKREPVDSFGQALTVANGIFHFTLVAFVLYEDHRAWLGLVATITAILYAFISSHVVRQPAVDTRGLRVFAGAAAGFLLLATPFLASGPAITLVWCAETVFLAWACTQPRFEFLRLHVVTMLAIIALRLLWFDALLEPARPVPGLGYLPFAQLRSYPPFAAALTFAIAAHFLGRLRQLGTPVAWLLGVGVLVLSAAVHAEAVRLSRFAFAPRGTRALQELIEAGLLIGVMGALWFGAVARLAQGRIPVSLRLGFAALLLVWVLEVLVWPGGYGRMLTIVGDGYGLVWLHIGVLLMAPLALLLASLGRDLREPFGSLSAERLRAVCYGAAVIVAMLLLRREMFAITHAPPVADWFSDAARLASYRMLLSLSYAFLAFGVYLGAVRSGNRPQLYAAYALYGVTAFKVYIFDLEDQHQLYRAFSLLIFAAILFVSSYFANRQQRSHA
jgi:hypothetical protein